MARGEPIKVRDSEVRGLIIVIKSKTSASWLLRYQRHHRESYLGLGSVRDVPLKIARERAREARLQLSGGTDPLAAKREAKAAAALAAKRTMTFQAAATEFFNQHEARWGNHKFRNQFINSLRDYAFPKIGSLPVAAIDTALVIQVLDPIWKDKTVTADRVRSRIEMVLAWATVRGLRTGDNPARWRGHLATHFPAKAKVAKVEHHAAMAYSELPEFLATVRNNPTVAARALEFLIYTAARAGEVIGAHWREVDLPEAIWTSPAERMKAAREHRVPLAAPVIKLLKALPRYAGDDSDVVFVGANPGSPINHNAFFKLLRKLGANVTAHGFRSTFRTWASERTAIPDVVAELALAHNVGSAVEKAYQRSDLFAKRAKLMEAWATYCTSPVKTPAHVVPLRATPR